MQETFFCLQLKLCEGKGNL